MFRKYYPFIILIIFALLLAGGFFIGKINFAKAQEFVFEGLTNDGNLDLPWLGSNCQTQSYQGGSYIKMLNSDSIIMSPSVLLEGYDNYFLSFEAKTYGTTTGEYKKIEVIVFSLGSNSTTTILTAYPSSSTFEQFKVSLNSFAGQQILLHFQTPNAQSGKGIAIWHIKTVGTKNINPPIAIATSSANEAEVDEEINFDGRNSTDDGQIINWYWDFGDGHNVYASTTSHSYADAGIYEVYLSVADNDGLTATSAPLSINVSAATSSKQISNNFSALDLAINEIYPTPNSNEDEWLEIFNNTTSTINLSGWTLLDRFGSGWSTTTLSGQISALGFWTTSTIAGKLNNGGDDLILKDPSGKIIDQQAYGDYSNKQGEAWARSPDGTGIFSETITATRGVINIITARPPSSGGGGSNSSAPTAKTATATTSSAVVSSTLEMLAGKIIINEIFPNPIGPDDDNEFIELKNISTSTLDLAGIILTDATDNKFILKSSSTSSTADFLPAGDYFIFKRSQTGIALNNTGLEKVRLFDAQSNLLEEVDYVGENIEGVSYSRTDDGKWRWVKTPTPGLANATDELYPDNEQPAILDAAAVSEAKLIAVVKSTAKKSTAKKIYDTELENLGDRSAGDLVRIKGVVSSLPNTFSSQYFYVAAPDGGQAGSGVQIYCNKKDFPQLAIGDYIEVNGELALSSLGRRIKIKTKDDIKFLEHRDPPIPHQIDNSDIDDNEGSLVQIKGTILDIKGRNLTLDDGTAEARVYINNNIDLKDANVKAGNLLTVIGEVGKTTAGYRVMPRDLTDLKIEAGEVKGAYATATAGGFNFNSPYWYFGAIIVFLVGVVALLWWKLRKKV